MDTVILILASSLVILALGAVAGTMVLASISLKNANAAREDAMRHSLALRSPTTAEAELALEREKIAAQRELLDYNRMIRSGGTVTPPSATHVEANEEGPG